MTIVAEVRPQDAWYRENELPMGQTQQQMIPHVLRKQESPFLRAGGAEVEGLTRKWAKVFILAFGIGALDAGDTLGVYAWNNIANFLALNPWESYSGLHGR